MSVHSTDLHLIVPMLLLMCSGASEIVNAVTDLFTSLPPPLEICTLIKRCSGVGFTRPVGQKLSELCFLTLTNSSPKFTYSFSAGLHAYRRRRAFLSFHQMRPLIRCHTLEVHTMTSAVTKITQKVVAGLCLEPVLKSGECTYKTGSGCGHLCYELCGDCK